ncbi:unnamed protein product [Urochloa decumbens]|uniref:NAC domain-containing protein n=1 Tax=Urochloa decumbens TaxID=240449 RepID=A0ABC9CV63_9POAL
MRKAASSPAPPSSGLHEEETDDGWVLLRAGGCSDTAARPPRPPPCPAVSARPPAGRAQPQSFDPSPDDLVGRYLPARRALRCGDLPPQIHDDDVYGAHHPAFLAEVHPPANAHRPEWLFFTCRGRGLGGKRRAGPGAYRLAGEAAEAHPRRGAGAWYCHSFRYHEDSVDASAARETEWRMDEYGDRASAAGASDSDFDMVVCKVYPARGGALHKRLLRRLDGGAGTGTDEVIRPQPQVLVQLYLGSLDVGDPLRCRMHAAADVCAAHPAVLTAVLPAANDRFEWLFVSRRRRRTRTEGAVASSRRAGAGEYVPAARYWGVKDGQGRDLGYRRVFRYREDDGEVRRASQTVWFMEEYGFGPDFPYGEHGSDEELVVYKVYLRVVRWQDA